MKKIVEPNGNDEYYEEEYFDEDDEPDGEPDYYYCNCCGYSTITDYGGLGCPRCGAIMEEEWY